MKWLWAALVAGGLAAWPSHGWAECTYHDGTAAPAPGLSQQAMESDDWAPTFARLLSRLNEGDTSTLVAMINIENSALVTNRCSDNDLLWTHLSLVGLSRLDPDSMPAEMPAEVAATVRAFTLTAQGREVLPGLMRNIADPAARN